MIIQMGLRKELIHKRYVLGAHPILQHFMDRLKIPEIMSTYLPKDQRTHLSTEKTLTELRQTLSILRGFIFVTHWYHYMLIPKSAL